MQHRQGRQANPPKPLLLLNEKWEPHVHHTLSLSQEVLCLTQLWFRDEKIQIFRFTFRFLIYRSIALDAGIVQGFSSQTPQSQSCINCLQNNMPMSTYNK